MDNYILRCTKEQYQQYKDELTLFIEDNTKSPIDILNYSDVFLILYLSNNEFEIMKAFCDNRGLSITLDAMTMKTD